MPRTSTRNQFWASGRRIGRNTLVVNSGSKPNSSMAYRPLIRERVKATMSSTDSCQSTPRVSASWSTA